jgi:mono/diheme cytochrome c family protein
MPAWGDKKALTPQQIADVISYVISLNPASAASAGSPTGTSATKTSAASTAKPGAAVTGTAAASLPGASQTQTEPEATEEIARPSNPGGPGAAIDLTGDATSGQQIFATNCQTCHNAEGKGGIPNPGSTDGTVPSPNPTFSMPPWGDKKALNPQQIADVIAYLISLNK